MHILQAILLEITPRVVSPLWIKLLLLMIALLIGVFFAFDKTWVELSIRMAFSPFNRLTRYTEYIKIRPIYLSLSIFTYACVLALCITTQSNLTQIFNISSAFLPVFLTSIVILTLRFFCIQFFFSIHKHAEFGKQLSNYHIGYNQVTMLFGLVYLLVLFTYFRGIGPSALYLIIAFVVFLLLRLYGTILFLLTKFNFSFLAIFVYLCAFEIAPWLLFSKMLLTNN